MSRKRVILKALKTLTEAAQFARFEVSAVSVARNNSTPASTPNTLSSLGFRGRESSSGPSGFASRGFEQSITRFRGFLGRGRNRSVGRGAFNSESRASSSEPKFGIQEQSSASTARN